jgi:MFS family permease
MVAEFLMSYGSMVLITGSYDWALNVLNAPASQRLWISAFWGFCYFFISLLGGRISEKLGPRAAATLMCGLSILSSLLCLLMIPYQTIWMVPLTMMFYNLTCSTVWPAIESGLTRSPGKMPLSRRIAVFNITWGCAGFVATFTHGMLENISYSLIFIVPAVAAALAAITLALWAIPASMIGTHNVPDTASGEHELDDPKVRARAHTLLKMAWLTNPLAYVAIYALIPVMTQLTQFAGIGDLGNQGMVGSVWFGARFIGFGLAGAFTFWHYKTSWQIGPLIALAASFGAMLLFHNIGVLIALQAIFGLSAAIIYSASLYYSMHVSSGHGGHAAFHEAVVGIGTMVGPMIGALAATGTTDPSVSMPRVAYSVSGILLAGLVALFLMSARRKPEVEPRAATIREQP